MSSNIFTLHPTHPPEATDFEIPLTQLAKAAVSIFSPEQIKSMHEAKPDGKDRPPVTKKMLTDSIQKGSFNLLKFAKDFINKHTRVGRNRLLAEHKFLPKLFSGLGIKNEAKKPEVKEATRDIEELADEKRNVDGEQFGNDVDGGETSPGIAYLIQPINFQQIDAGSDWASVLKRETFDDLFPDAIKEPLKMNALINAIVDRYGSNQPEFYYNPGVFDHWENKREIEFGEEAQKKAQEIVDSGLENASHLLTKYYDGDNSRVGLFLALIELKYNDPDFIYKAFNLLRNGGISYSGNAYFSFLGKLEHDSSKRSNKVNT